MKKFIVFITALLLLHGNLHAQKSKKKKSEAPLQKEFVLMPANQDDSLMVDILVELQEIVTADTLPYGWRPFQIERCPHPSGCSPEFGWPRNLQLQWLCSELIQENKNTFSEFQVLSNTPEFLGHRRVVMLLYPDKDAHGSLQLSTDGGKWLKYVFKNGQWVSGLDQDGKEVILTLWKYLHGGA